MDIPNEKEEITAQSQVIVDCDMSDEKIASLIKLGHEEESLDYKETFDFSSNSAKKRSKVDLVCDVVAMANTNGGYIIIGVKDNRDGTFKFVGVKTSCLEKITQENIQTWISNYVDASIKVLVKTSKYEGKDLITVCTPRARIPVPFSKHGQYMSENLNNESKFHEGDFFVRHGSKSERANYSDIMSMTLRIREDERRKVNPQADITSRLDTIIQLLGGAPQTLRALDLSEGNEADIEDRVVQLISSQNTMILKRALKKEFQRIIQFLLEQCENENIEEVIENLNRTFITFLLHLFPVWVIAIEYDNLELGKELTEEIHKLYIKIDKIGFKHGPGWIDKLWPQSLVVYLAYLLGGYSILQEKPEFARLLVDKGNPFNEYWRNKSWFRYILTMLSRKQKLQNKSLCPAAVDFCKNSLYVIELFDSEKKLTETVCQFDFLQCAFSQTKVEEGMVCYPSFGAYYKWKIVPIVKKFIQTCESGVWLPKINKSDCARIIDDLDKYASDQFGFLGPWDYGHWEPEIDRFLEENKSREGT